MSSYQVAEGWEACVQERVCNLAHSWLLDLILYLNPEKVKINKCDLIANVFHAAVLI